MRKLEIVIPICVAILPIISALIVLWSDVQTIKATKAEYREVAELKTEMTKQLSKNTEAINNLNRTINRILEGG
jgi:hypothetical protein